MVWLWVNNSLTMDPHIWWCLDLFVLNHPLCRVIILTHPQKSASLHQSQPSSNCQLHSHWPLCHLIPSSTSTCHPDSWGINGLFMVLGSFGNPRDWWANTWQHVLPSVLGGFAPAADIWHESFSEVWCSSCQHKNIKVVYTATWPALQNVHRPSLSSRTPTDWHEDRTRRPFEAWHMAMQGAQWFHMASRGFKKGLNFNMVNISTSCNILNTF